MTNRSVTTAFVYDIIGHKLSQGETASEGIEQYTKELVRIKLALEELERDITELSINKYGLDTGQEFQNPFEVVWFLLKNLGDGVTEQDEIVEFEQEHQLLLDRIASTRDAMISGRVSSVDSIDSSEFNSRLAKQEMSNWVQDGTFPKEIEKLESAADRVDRRLNTKRETANTRISLAVSMVTVLISLTLLAFAVLSFLVSVMSVISTLL